MRLAVNAWFWDRPTTGSGQYTHRLVEGLAALDPTLEILLIAPRGLGVATRPFSSASPPEPLMPEISAGPTKIWFEQVAFPRACARLAVDLAHVPYWGSPLQPPVPTMVTIHDLIPRLLPAYRGGPLVRAYTALVTRSARKAPLALTDSAVSRCDIIDHLHLSAQHVRAIPLAADARYDPRPSPQDVQVRSRYGVSGRYVLYLGGFDVRKNVGAAIQAYAQALAGLDEQLTLVIAGRLPERDTAFAPDPRHVIEGLGPEDGRVRTIGFVEEPDKPALYRGAMAFIFPSRYEGFGLPPLEALACGTPVVAGDRGSLPEVVGEAGVLVDPDDIPAMARALARLATDGELRAELSRRAIKQASRFSWHRTASETLAAYREALA